MMKQAVIDSNVLVAILDSRDNWHRKAQALLNALEAERVSLVYFDCVLNETVSVLARRGEEQKRSEQFSMLLDKLLIQVPIDNITWISSEIQRLYQKTIEQVRQTGGVLNFHDALMALYCRECEINAIISFDQDFDRISWLKRIVTPEDVKAMFQLNSSTAAK
jgi:predicted nucleic acid-binding protein